MAPPEIAQPRSFQEGVTVPEKGANIAVIGGGFLGMTLSDRLTALGHRVTLIEASTTLGGMADAWSLGDIVWDRHYHVILESDSHLVRLLESLGLKSKIHWTTTRTGFFTGNRHVSMSNSVEFLRFPPLNLIDKTRLALTILYCSRVRDWRRLEQIPVLDFVNKWSGQATTAKIWKPLLRAKLGRDLDDVSAAFIWASIRRMYAARRSGMKTERFGYVEGGYSTIIEAYRQRLEGQGVRILVESPVQKVVKGQKGLCVETIEGNTQNFDAVVMTQASPLTAKLCPDLDAKERAVLEDVRYRGVVCASLLLRRGLKGFYVTNITEDWVPFTGVIEMSALVPPAQLGNHHLIYLPAYLDPADPAFDEPDDTIVDRCFRALKRMYPDLEDSDLVAAKVSKVRRVTAVPTLGFSQRIPPFTTSIDGLFTVNSSQIVNGTLNVDETLQLAESALTILQEAAINSTR